MIVSVTSPSVAFAGIIMLLLPTLFGDDGVHASNNFDNSNQKKLLEFTDTINLTNNERDSVYGQVSTSNENVYVVWQESIPESDPRNYDIMFKRSTDNGSSFSREINLSNNIGFSEHPQISSAANNVYVIWADDTNGNNKNVYVRTSSDNGKSFGKEMILRNGSRSESFNVDITAFGNNVYTVWLEKAFSGPSYRVMLAVSDDNGNSFENPITICEDVSAQSHPKISTFNNHIYVVWNVDDIDDQSDITSKGGIFFTSSSDNGATFGNASKLNTEENGFGEAQVTSSGDEVYVIWGGSDYNKVSSLYFVKSDDNGRNFSEIKKIDQIQQNEVNNPTNVEIAIDELDRLFIAWQDTVGPADKDDILFATSLNGGESFQDATNISNNVDISECPSLVVNGDNVYITWEDLTPGNHEILYRQGYYYYLSNI